MKLGSLKTTPETNVSHNAAIKRRRMISMGDIPSLTNFSQATFPPGEVAPAHRHADMVEVFFVQKGEGSIVMDGITHALKEGDFIQVDIGEEHELQNTSSDDLVVLYFGITV